MYKKAREGVHRRRRKHTFVYLRAMVFKITREGVHRRRRKHTFVNQKAKVLKKAREGKNYYFFTTI